MGSNKVTGEPMVSVWMMTYNQEKYIRQALDGVFMQQVDFTYEIVIGEDCSQDDTRDILLEYKEKYPDKMKLILHEKNIGMYENMDAVFRQCKGKYIAMCEGDDYWVDPYKLTKQVDFLENHPEYIGTAHRMQIVDVYGNPRKSSSRVYCQDEIYTLKHHTERNLLPGHTATLVFRNILVSNPAVMNAFDDCKALVDIKTALLLTLHGNIYCLPEVMSHYRHDPELGDSWTVRAKERNLNLVIFNARKDLFLLAKRLKNIEIDYTACYLDCGYSAFIFFVKKPNAENFEILKGIFKGYNKKTAMTLHILNRSITWPFRKVKQHIVKSSYS